MNRDMHNEGAPAGRGFRAWRELSIQGKITAVSLATSVAVLLFATITFVVYDQITFRRSAQQQVVAVTDLLARSTRAALAFRDDEAAARMLSLVQAERHIVHAEIFDAENKTFVRYRKPGLELDIRPPAYGKDSHRRHRGHLCLTRAIRMEDGEIIGTLYVCRDISDGNIRLATYVVIAAGILLAACLGAWRLSVLLQSLVSRPIMDLRDAAVRVTDLGDYSVRVDAAGGAEVGRLVGAFNEMLEQIQQRDLALLENESHLNQYRDQLRLLVSQLSLAEEKERRRIATDLHDSVCQLLWASRLKLNLLARAESDLRQSDSVTEIGDLMDQALRECRTLTFDVSPPELYELGLEAALDVAARNLKARYGIHVSLTCDKPPVKIDGDMAVVLFRATKELMTNVVKHAEATCMHVEVQQTAESITISVTDDGKGIGDGMPVAEGDSAAGGFGLFSIKERIQHLGGSMAITTPSGGGTCIILTVPVQKNSDVAQGER